MDPTSFTVGDQLLCAAAGRINACIREEELVARPGGDEFAVLITTHGGEVEGLGVAIAKRIVNSFQLPVAVGERMISTHVSVGLATSRHSVAAGEAQTPLLQIERAVGAFVKRLHRRPPC